MDSDKDAIRELLHLYCFHMDEGRFSDLAALFAADGEWIAPYRSARGPTAIAAWLTESVPPSPRRMRRDLARALGNFAACLLRLRFSADGRPGANRE